MQCFHEHKVWFSVDCCVEIVQKGEAEFLQHFQ